MGKYLANEVQMYPSSYNKKEDLHKTSLSNLQSTHAAKQISYVCKYLGVIIDEHDMEVACQRNL